MTFTEWIFLLGGLAVAGPVIAHLLAKPRYRRLPFTMLRFLQAGKAESRSRKKLRDLLLLLLRCAIITLIAMLFARPLLRRKAAGGPAGSVHYLGLDNSMSMAYDDGSGSYFERMIDKAIDYIRSSDDKALFNLCSLASGDWANGLTRDQALAEVQGLRLVPHPTDIDGFLSVVGADARGQRPAGSVSLMIISDFTPKTLAQFAAVQEPAVVDTIDYAPIVSSRPINNAAIVDAHVVDIDDGTLTLNVTIACFGQIGQKRRLTASIDSAQSKPVEISLAPNQRKLCTIRMDIDAAVRRRASLPVQLSLSPGDGLAADDTFRIAVSPPQHRTVRVLLADTDGGETFLLKTAIDTLSRSDSCDNFETGRASLDALASADLERADVVICSTIADALRGAVEQLKDFVNAGGRLVFFITGEPSPGAVNELWRAQLLPALPGRCVFEPVYIKPAPEETGSLDARGLAAKALSNYGIDRIVLRGSFKCQQHPDSRCAWRLQNGQGLVYLRSSGRGSVALVNTSADDSLGSLSKSNAAVAFCSYILGDANRSAEYCFACDEKVVLPLPAGQPPGPADQLWLQTCDGRKHRAAVQQSVLLVPEPGGIGWVKTLGRDTVCAGINLPKGETDMTAPPAAELAGIINRAFSLREKRDIAPAQIIDEAKYRPIWKTFAWILIALLLAEPAVANRLKR
ncbi:MAG: BatA domain-containing protein [Phycisphaerales bacterium]|nr:MAG: BatA domain-containing protein [Phycisphaerales bacterium]